MPLATPPKRVWFIILTATFLFPINAKLFASNAAQYTWKTLTPGLSYARAGIKNNVAEGYVHLFEIDPKRVSLKIVTAKELGLDAADAKVMQMRTGARLVVNGGFFDENGRSIGLLINNGNVINPIHRTSWWSIFMMKDGRPQIVLPKEFKATPDISVAIQAGPRLIVNGEVVKGLKDDHASRSAIGVTAEGKVVITVTEKAAPTNAELGEFLRGLGLIDAMALDGGTSSQLYAKMKGFELVLPSTTNVANGIGVFDAK